jgi:hypothetical protein
MASKNPPPTPGPTLPCEQCGYVNEPERVYCHNCGSKLDRTLLPKAEEKKQENASQARKRIEKMTNPKSGAVGREIKAFLKVVFFSALLAAAILFFCPPTDLPEVKKDQEMRLVSSDMMEALDSPTPRAVSFSEGDINQYLNKQALKTPQDTMIPGVQLVHAYAACSPGVLHIFAEFSPFGFQSYARVDYKLEVKDGKFIPTIVGGAFGRLAIDPQLMQYGDAAFSTLWTALQRERKQMDRMQSVTVREGRIDLVSKGTNAGR